MYEIIVGRSEKDREEYGTKGAIFLGKHYVRMGQTTSLSNPIYLDVVSSHVVFVCGKRGGGKCLCGDAIITLEDGSQIPIKELEKNDKQIYSLDSNLKIRQSARSQFYKRKVNKILKLKLRSGKEIKLTPEHPLLTIRGWMPAEKLHVGSRIATPRRIESFGREFLPEHKVKLLAYLIAEGHLSNNFVLFSNTEKAIISDFEKAVNEFDNNLKIRVHSKKYCWRVVENKKRKVDEQSARGKDGRFIQGARFDSKSSLRKWLGNIGLYGKLSSEKTIPGIIFNLPKNKIALFLNRLFSCDGSIFKEGDNYWKVSYSSSSEDLATQVQHLLLRFGIISKLRKKETRKLPSYEIIIRGEQVHTFLNEIGLFGLKDSKARQALKETIQIIRNLNLDTIPKEIWEMYKPDSWAEIGRRLHYSIPKSFRESKRYSPSRQKLLQIAKADESELLEKFASSDIFWDEVSSAELIEGECIVYDLTVPEHHNFIANDIIVHNSYSMGVIAEGISSLSPEIKDNIAVVMLDTMGIYWTMKYPNKIDALLLKEWELDAKPLDVKLFTPIGYYKEYKEKGIPTDFPFSIKPSELSPSDWQLTFNISSYEPVGVLIESVINSLKEPGSGALGETKPDFSMEDIISAIGVVKDFDESVKNAAKNRFISAKRWGLFSEKGTPLDDLVKGGQISVLDVSCYAVTPGAEGLRALVIGLVSQKLFIHRMIARKKEEYDMVNKSVNYFSDVDKEQTKQEYPLVWLIIDEAHEFLPNKGSTAASNALITILREGRQPGISLILASQQPGKIHTDVMTQSDIVISHRVTAKVDVDALGMLMQSYMREGLDKQLNYLPRVTGSAIVFDDCNERIYSMRVRPRFTWHGGSAPVAMIEKKKVFDF